MDFREVIVIDDGDDENSGNGFDISRVENDNENGNEIGDCEMGSKELVIFPTEPCNEMPLAALPPESGLAVSPRRGNRIPGQVIQNPEWLPSGWITEMKIRKTGSSAGHMDKYFYEIETGKKCRSRLEVFRYIENGLFSPEMRSLPDVPSSTPAIPDAIPDPVACRPTYYYQPVMCESPAYAEHPGLFPVVYFPVIGDSPEDQFKPPPMDILANMQLKPIFSGSPSCNVPSPPNCKQHFGNVQEQKKKKKKTRMVSGLAESYAVEDLNSPSSWDGKFCGNYPVNDTTPHPTSLTLSCNNSHFRVTVPQTVLNHIQYNPNYNPCQSSGVMPCQDQNNGFNASSKSTPVRMRGHLSEARLLALKKDLKL